jgi:hypothetical protein
MAVRPMLYVAPMSAGHRHGRDTLLLEGEKARQKEQLEVVQEVVLQYRDHPHR